jgi:hypothetical protein
MIYYLKSLFKKSNYKILGRGGIEFLSHGKIYYVDTNNFIDGNDTIEIFYKEIKLIGNDIQLNDNEKKELAKILKTLLGKDGLTANILPI